MSVFTGWGTALRIARREARRAKGRSALVLAMILVPVAAIAFAAVTYDMFNLTPRENLDREIGGFDAQLRWPIDGAIRQAVDGRWDSLDKSVGHTFKPTDEPTDEDVLKLLPPGSRVVRWNPASSTTVHTRTGIAGLNSRVIDLHDSYFAPIVHLTRGTAPSGDAEVALTVEAARRTGVDVGGTVRLADGSKEYRVTGLVEFPGALLATLVFPPGAGHPPDAGSNVGTWLVDTPAPLDWAAVKRLNEHGVTARSRAVLLDPPPPSEVDFPADTGSSRDVYSVGALVVGLGMLEIVLLAGPAFAVGARRRRRELALVAANGGAPAHLRRIVLADGVLLGAVGAVLGIALGIGIAFAGRPIVEHHLVHSRAGGYRVFPLALLAIAGLAILTGLLAALVPAFSAARQNIVASLAGRRGVVRSRKRWIAVGLTLLGAGAAAALTGVLLLSSIVLTAGLVVAELGLVLCTPALIGLVARVGGSLPLSARIALRDTSRNRASAAPAISAVMAAVAASVMIGVVITGDRDRNDLMYAPVMPYGYVSILGDPTYTDGGGPGPAGAPAPKRLPASELDRVARRTLPVRDTVPVFREICPPDSPDYAWCTLSVEVPAERQCPASFTETRTRAKMAAVLADPRCHDRPTLTTTGRTSQVLDDGSSIGQLSGATGDDLTRAVATLRAGGVVVTDPRKVSDGKATIVAYMTGGPDREPRRLEVPGYALTSSLSEELTVIAPVIAQRAGFTVEEIGIVAATTRMPSTSEQDALRAAVADLSAPYYIEVEHEPDFDDQLTALLLAVAAGVIALGAAAIATGLSAVDGRANLATLASVGASPGLRRRLSLSQSGVIAGLGSLLGAGVGAAAGIAVLASMNRDHHGRWPAEVDYPISMPWLSLLIAVVVAPAVAMLGAGLLTRSRLPIERRL
jgi:putative ABC transport system permease protein